jgi:hypothetical protein
MPHLREATDTCRPAVMIDFWSNMQKADPWEQGNSLCLYMAESSLLMAWGNLRTLGSASVEQPTYA